MGKHEEYIKGRNDGICFAAAIAKDKGVEALLDEVKSRGMYRYQSTITAKEAAKFDEEVRHKCYMSFSLFVSCLLYDKYGFDGKMIDMFLQDFYDAASAEITSPEDFERIYKRATARGLPVVFDMEDFASGGMT